LVFEHTARDLYLANFLLDRQTLFK